MDQNGTANAVHPDNVEEFSFGEICVQFDAAWQDDGVVYAIHGSRFVECPLAVVGRVATGFIDATEEVLRGWAWTHGANESGVILPCWGKCPLEPLRPRPCIAPDAIFRCRALMVLGVEVPARLRQATGQ